MTWFRFVVQSHIWIALGAAMLTLLTEIECFERASVAPLVVAFSTLLVYNLLRWVKLKQAVSLQIDLQKASLSPNMHRGLVLLAALGLAFTLPHLAPAGLLILAIAAVPAVGYGLRIFPSSVGWSALRELPYMKLPLVALVWTLATVLYPAVQAENQIKLPSEFVLMYSAERLFFVLALTIPFDVRDMHFDSPRLQTLPMAIGERRSGYVAIAILVLLSGLHLILGVGSTHILHSVAYALSALAIWPLTQRKLSDLSPLYYTGLLDGLLILLPASVLLLRLVCHV
jgi:hypothetical protein